jgi:hypothetical protein
LRDQALRLHVSEGDWDRTIPVDVGTISSVDFNLTSDDKNFLISRGQEAAKAFLERMKKKEEEKKKKEEEKDSKKEDGDSGSEGQNGCR